MQVCIFNVAAELLREASQRHDRSAADSQENRRAIESGLTVKNALRRSTNKKRRPCPNGNEDRPQHQTHLLVHLAIQQPS